MYILIFIVLYSAPFFVETDGAPSWSWGKYVKEEPQIQTSRESSDSCPNGTKCLQVSMCPEEERLSTPYKFCSDHSDGHFVCCTIHRDFNGEHSIKPNSSSNEPPKKPLELNLRTHSRNLGRDLLFPETTGIHLRSNDSYPPRSTTIERDEHDGDNDALFANDYKSNSHPSEYRQHYNQGFRDRTYADRRNQRPNTYNEPSSRDSWNKPMSSGSNWGNDKHWYKPTETGNSYEHDEVDYSYAVNTRAKVTKNPWDIDYSVNPSKMSVVYWDGRNTVRLSRKTTKPGWNREYTSNSEKKSATDWEKQKTTSIQREKSTKPYWNGEYSSSVERISPVIWSTSRPGKKTTKNLWSTSYSKSSERTMVHGNRIPTQPQRNPPKESNWDGKLITSSVRKSTKAFVDRTTPLPGRKPVPWGSYYTTQSRSMATTKSSHTFRTTPSYSRRGTSTSSPTKVTPRTDVTKRYPTASRETTWIKSTTSSSNTWATAKPLTTKSSQSRLPSSTKKYTTTTPLPNINIQMCGVREPNPEISGRGRNAIIRNNSDDVVKYPENRNGGRSRVPFQRIVGGEEAEPFSWPWVAALYRVAATGGNRFLCAGSLINEQYVLTAAHVFTPRDLRSASFVVMLGTHTTKEAVAEYAVSSVLQHPGYHQRFYYNDIALLKLKHPVVFNNYVMPVCLPSPSVPLLQDVDLVGKRVTVMGWGDESYGGITSRVLKEASFQILSRQSCNASYIRVASNRFPKGITTDMLCAGDPNGGKDACQGDSGGPLTTVENGRYTQVGIVSFGYKCGDKEYPGVYTKVAPYLNWIAANAKCDEYDYYAR